MIEQLQGQQSRHAAVPIRERMDAQEVQHVGRDEQQGVEPAFVQQVLEAVVQAVEDFQNGRLA